MSYTHFLSEYWYRLAHSLFKGASFITYFRVKEDRFIGAVGVKFALKVKPLLSGHV